jgi:hypothetical protein
VTQWFVESKLAERLGLTRDALEEFRKRHLKKEGDWKRENGHVLLRESAVKKMLARLDAPNFDYSACAQKNGADDDLRELAITRVFPNPHLIEARDPETNELVRVSVPNNVNFRPRMTLKARPVARGAHLYRLEGRTPRFPGRW